MAIVRPNIYSPVAVADPLAPARMQRENARADNVTRQIDALNNALVRQQAIDSALKIQDSRRRAAQAERDARAAEKKRIADEEAAAGAGLLGVLDSVDTQGVSDEVRNLEGERYGYTVTDSLDNLTAGSVPVASTLGDMRNVNLGAAPTRAYDGLGDEGLIETLKNALRRVQDEQAAAEMFGGIAPPSSFAGVDLNRAQLSQALDNLTAGPVDTEQESQFSSVRRRPRGEVVDPRPQMARQKRMDLVAAAGDRARYAPPNLNLDQKAAIEQALAVLTSGNIDAGSSMGEARGMGSQQRNVPEDMMRDRLQRILNQEYFGTEQDRVGNLLGILERVRRNEPLTPDEQIILDNFLMFERAGQRPPARGGSQQIGPLRRSEMVGE